MKVTIKGTQYTLVAIVPEEVEVGLFKKLLKAVIYVYDKTKTPYKFLAEEIERYD